MTMVGLDDIEDESNPRIVRLNDWKGTVVGLAFDPEPMDASTLPFLKLKKENFQGQGVERGEDELRTLRNVSLSQTSSGSPGIQEDTVAVGSPKLVASDVLGRLKGVARKCLHKKTIDELVEKLLALDLPTRERAASELANVSLASREHKLKIAETPRALDGLVSLLQLNTSGVTSYEVECAKAQKEATRALMSLACEQENRWIISEYPYALSGLIKVLMTNCECDARKWTAQTLGHLCSHSLEVRVKVGRCPHAFATLVKLILKDDAAVVREECARTLGILLRGHSEHKRKIATISTAITALVKMLTPQESTGGQKMGALCLAQLDHSEEILIEIASTPGVLTSLVGMLSVDERPRLKSDLNFESGIAVRSPRHHFHQLSSPSYKSPRHKAVDSAQEALPDQLGTLVGLLLNQDNVVSQRRTAYTLSQTYARERRSRAAAAGVPFSFACRNDMIFQHMMFEDRLTMDDEERADCALNFLAAAREKKLLMSDYPKAILSSVGHLLSERDGHRSVRGFGALLVASLARVYGNRRRIAECHGLLAGLIALLGKNDCLQGQTAACCALANIAHGDRQIQANITKISNASVVSSLVTLILKRENHELQSQAMRALACLGSVRDADNNLVIMGKYPNILTDLARILFQSEVPSVQEEAAWALVNIGQQ